MSQRYNFGLCASQKYIYVSFKTGCIFILCVSKVSNHLQTRFSYFFDIEIYLMICMFEEEYVEVQKVTLDNYIS